MGCVYSKTLSRKSLLKLIDKRNASTIIYDEHQEIMNMVLSGSLCSSASTETLQRSQREEEELLFEDSRVVLSDETGSCTPTNASYINGFKDPQAYIATRTPDSESTIFNFWRMIWQHQTEIIVMLDQPEENLYAASLWNSDEESLLQVGQLSIKKFRAHQNNSSFQILRVLITHEDGATLNVNYFLFKNWQRQGLPPSECHVLDLIFMTRLYNKSAVTPESVKGYKSPIVVHCSDGLQRSMVFCAVDIGISSISIRGEVNLYSIVSNLRKERHNCLYDVNDYTMCYLLLHYYCMFYM
ncbi:GSCOCT00014314001.2-RA-CDS [Cotesia congregata]|uniref:Cc_ptp.p_1.9 n=2 Tax=root TaxID=1 RepID=S6CVU6_COTCN|nr:PTPP [Bracoviriform congregatae]CAD6244250.1 GSCOCT00014314001.2-RA-CDS [Cotesia congregata]CAG17387.1 PTPP [Bracoviriform congregatae]CAG26735.1 protein tyrosine phosphatase [Bracoviriform congregatae]CAG5093990.1 cc_ptp.p_1.9 [Cotesia congregata]CCQ71322.1 protein tyrosine phosphatase PTPP [Cotesia congregata]